MSEDRDRYQAFYTEHLWMLLPEIYRASDSEDPEKKGPLRELVERIGTQAAVLRRSIDRAWEDQSIETCDDWLIPYIGELLATNLVAGLDARAQRLDVANTIYYRRRKGTVAILEEIAADITGWNARIVEFFRRLARTRHSFDPEIGLDLAQGVIEGLRGTLSGTPAGGFADLRHAGAAQKTMTAFDEYFHTADFRRGREATGWHNIPKLGVFLWRLKSFRHGPATPVQDAICPGQFTFDPTGREIPLFARDERGKEQYGDAWVTPDEWMLPGPITAELLERESVNLYPGSLAVVDVSAAGETQLPAGDFEINPERGRFREAAGPAPGAARRVRFHHGFSSEIGAGPYDRRATGETPVELPEPVGAAVTGGGAALQAALAALGATGTVVLGDSLTYDAVADLAGIGEVVITAELNERPVVRLDGGEWVFEGAPGARLTLESVLVSGADVVLRGEFEQVLLTCATIDPGEEVQLDGTLPEAVDGRPLRPGRVWIEGAVAELALRRAICGPIRTRAGGAVERIVAADSILQGVRTALFEPLTEDDFFDLQRFVGRLRDGEDELTAFLRGGLAAQTATDLAALAEGDAADAALVAALLTDLNATLTAGSIYTSARFAGVTLDPRLRKEVAAGPGAGELPRVNRLLLEAAYPLELGPAAIATGEGEVALERTTVLGRIAAHRISANECILWGMAEADDAQRGCVRFSTYALGSRLHQPYESVAIRAGAGIFVSRRFGQPGYAQLTRLADRAIVEGEPGGSIRSGAQNGSEAGAFAREMGAIKERGLKIKLVEFMPVGLTPVIIPMT